MQQDPFPHETGPALQADPTAEKPAPTDHLVHRVAPPSALHVYNRDISEHERTSLSVLAGRIHAGSTVLDLGTGSGAIGKFLSHKKSCTVDGVTYNAAEAQLALPHYRHIEVADLDHCDLPALFAGKRYDYIVCADVLEHIRMPERVIAACHGLLAEGDGRLLLSIPNTGYAGLIAELIGGEFKYREEGLLDATHVRHFTRQTLLRFLREGGYRVEAVEPIARALPESEFTAAFDALPPAVARYLLATPDSQTYQFIVVARPLAFSQAVTDTETFPDEPAQALFTAQLFPGTGGVYAEAEKLVATGVIGAERQTLRFALPDRPQPATGLRFDPADRPGFLHLYSMRLLAANGSLLWHWDSARDGMDAFARARSSQIVLQPPWPMAGATPALLHGDDPWIELPLPETAVQRSRGGRLEVELGWPMSADYIALARSTGELAARLSDNEERAVARIALLNGEMAGLRESLGRDIDAMTEKARGLHLQVESLTRQIETVGTQNKDLREQKQALLLRNSVLGRERDGAVAHVEMIENSTVFRATRPVVNAKMKLDRALGRAPGEGASENEAADAAPETARAPIAPPPHPVDVIVPVYKGLADTRLCIESVLKAECKTPYRLVVINDASPEPEVTQYLRDAGAAEPRIMLLENEENLGFVATVNRGMALSGDNDVLLLNSDTEVAGDWLDRLRATAYSDKKIASVTPFSNNATICSYPRFCEDNDLPAGWDTARLDALFASANPGQMADVPTGIGFCMYVRRDALSKVGLFDVENFGKGYGEENDFCQRALEAGWRNVHALDTFVMHSGGVSFGDSKSPREQAAMEILRRMHPTYETQVHTFLAQDPARLARLSVDLARIETPRLPGVLAVLHDRGGGTARHVRELALHESGRAVFFTLRPTSGGNVLLELASAGEGFALAFKLPHQYDDLILALRALDVRLIHFHHLIGHDDLIVRLPERLGVAYDFTAHDFYTVCPQITFTYSDPTHSYCTEKSDEQCKQCLRRSPAPGGLSIEAWREKYSAFLRGARHVLAPSRDAITHLAHYVPTAHLHFVPHTDIDPAVDLPAPRPQALAPGAPLKIAVIGAMSPIKGADVLEDVAAAAAKNGAAVDFHLIGFGYRSLKTQPRARLTVHGEYQDEDLPALLDWLEPDLVWFPALWPETYSYTLSACLQAGLPVVAPDIGAFAERLSGRAWSWVRPWSQTPAEWLAFFDDVRERHFASGQAPAPVIRLATPPSELQDALNGGWSYSVDYLKGIETQAAEGLPGDSTTSDAGGQLSPEDGAAIAVSSLPTLDRAFIAAHLPDRKSGLRLAHGVKGRMLHAALRLRAAPGLSRVARTIPLRWQTRFKTWLRA